MAAGQSKARAFGCPRTGSAWGLLAACLLALIQCGCFRDTVLDVRSLGTCSDATIIVLTRDGWQYRFAGGQYAVTTDSSLGQVLQGRAKKYRRTEANFSDFSGRIPLDAVERVTITETTPWLYVSLGTVALMAGALIWLAISLQGFSAG